MKQAQMPLNEEFRMEVLKSLDLLDTLEEPNLDELTKLAKMICGTKIALISLIDSERQWFKSRCGLDASETPRDVAFCSHAILNDEPMIINDATKDERFCDNPLVTGEPHVIFYAGIPLVILENVRVGTLCVIDDHPREVTSEQLDALRVLANQIVSYIITRKVINDLAESQANLNYTLHQTFLLDERKARIFEALVHDIHSPVRHAKTFTQFFLEDNEDKFVKSEVKEVDEKIERSFGQIVELIDDYSKKYRNIHQDYTSERVDIAQEILGLTLSKQSSKFKIVQNFEVPYVNCDLFSFKLIMRNLIDNSIKYNKKENCVIDISNYIEGKKVYFTYFDNGPGATDEELKHIFENKYRIERDRKKFGTGKGLYLVKKLLLDQGGEISVCSAEKGGLKFTIYFGSGTY